MKCKKITALSLALMMLLSLLAGCSREEPAGVQRKPKQEETPAETPAPEPEPELPPEPQNVSEVYEAALLEKVYRITQLDLEGYVVEGGSLRDGRVLLELRQVSSDLEEGGYEFHSEENTEGGELDGSSSEEDEYPLYDEFGEYYYDVEPDWNLPGKIVVFPLLHPEQAAVKEIVGYDQSYRLLAGGQVMEYTYDRGYKIYDSAFSPVCSRAGSGYFSCVGDTDEGALWYHVEGSRLEKYLGEETLLSIAVDEETYAYDLLGEANGKAYFTFSGGDFNTYLSYVDLSDGSYHTEGSFSYYPISHNGRLSYNSEDRWQVATPEAPEVITEFTKPYSDESCFLLDENYLLGLLGYCDTETDTYLEDLHVYDLSNGGMCGALTTRSFEGHHIGFLDYEDGVVLIRDIKPEDGSCLGLYLWDISDLHAETPAKVYRRVNYQVDETDIEPLAQKIRDAYKVSVVYDAEGIKAYTGNYDLVPCSDTAVLGKTLILLEEWMSEYPAGFYEDLRRDENTELVIYLCEGHLKNSDYSLTTPSATTSSLANCLQMSIDVTYWYSLRRTLLHETMHLIENRLDDLTFNDLYFYWEYWNLELNSSDYPSLYTYSDDMFDEAYYTGTYSSAGDEAWYIDSYAKSTPMEDRARVFEQLIYSAGECYWECEHLNNKARFLCGMVREFFPSVSSSEAPVLWEQYIGIVNLQKEFPDYTERR